MKKARGYNNFKSTNGELTDFILGEVSNNKSTFKLLNDDVGKKGWHHRGMWAALAFCSFWKGAWYGLKGVGLDGVKDEDRALQFFNELREAGVNGPCIVPKQSNIAEVHRASKRTLLSTWMGGRLMLKVGTREGGSSRGHDEDIVWEPLYRVGYWLMRDDGVMPTHESGSGSGSNKRSRCGKLNEPDPWNKRHLCKSNKLDLHHTCHNLSCINPCHLKHCPRSEHTKIHNELRLCKKPRVYTRNTEVCTFKSRQERGRGACTRDLRGMLAAE